MSPAIEENVSVVTEVTSEVTPAISAVKNTAVKKPVAKKPVTKSLPSKVKEVKVKEAKEVKDKTKAKVKAPEVKAVKVPAKVKSVKAAKEPAAKSSEVKSDKPSNKLPIRKPQLRILQALAKAEGVLDRSQISEAATVDIAPLVEYLGSSDESRRIANDTKYFPSLITLGYVKLHLMEGQPATYSITAAGKKFEQTWSGK